MLKIIPALGLVGILALLTACGSTPTAVVAPATPTAALTPINTLPPEPTDTPAVAATEPTKIMEESTEVVEEPTPTDEPTMAPTPKINWRAVEGKTEDNLAYLGNPNAPVTILDYSDFL